MIVPRDLFSAPVKARILHVLADAAPGPVSAGDLCERVYGDRGKAKRDSLRNLIAQMRPRLSEAGFRILGRKELRENAYRIINEAL